MPFGFEVICLNIFPDCLILKINVTNDIFKKSCEKVNLFYALISWIIKIAESYFILCDLAQTTFIESHSIYPRMPWH